MTPAELRRRYRGAPECLRDALDRAARDPALPRATRRELAAARDALVVAPPRGVGVAAFPVVGAGGGCVYRVVVSDGWRGDLTPLPASAWTVPRRVLEQTLGDVGLDDARLHVTGPAPGEGWQGDSVQAAMVLALASWALRVPPARPVVTGRLHLGQLAPVDHAEAKATLVLRTLGVPLVHAGDRDVPGFLDLTLPGWAQAVATRRDRVLARAVGTADAALRFHRLGEALTSARAAQASDDPAVRARARWVEGTALLHLGEPDAAEDALAEAETLLPHWLDHPSDPPEDLVAEELGAYTLIARIDTGRAAAAWHHGRRLLEGLDAVARRTRRWRWVAVQVAGSTHRAAVLLGRLDDAAALLADWGLGRARLVDQDARVLGDRAEVARRTGDLDAASALLDQARAALGDAQDPDGTALFLDLFAARIAVAGGGPPPAVPAGRGMWPRLGFEVLAADDDALLAISRRELVADTPVLAGVVVAELARRLLARDAAALEVRLAELVAAWSFDDPALTALAERLAADPRPDDLAAWRRRAPYG